jgi:hypothetical protein
MENTLFKDLHEQIEINSILEETQEDSKYEEKLLSGELMEEIEFDVILK